LNNDTSAWIELTYDTPVYITSVQIRQVYNIGSIHKVRVWNNGEFCSADTSVLPVNCTESTPSHVALVLPISILILSTGARLVE
jgi:hypothetical protein